MSRRRLGILALYSETGYIYDYIQYILKELAPELSAFYIVCNGELNGESREKISPYVDGIYCREDRGYDAMALKEAMEKRLGWEFVESYDELVILNDSFFGPFNPFKQIFEEMREKDCDFWTLTSQQESYLMEEITPFHLQPYFLVVRSNLLKSNDFRDFWESLEEVKTYKDAVCKYELRLTSFFTNRGYRPAVYTEFSANDIQEIEERYLSLICDPYTMLVEARCPIIKKKCFCLPSKDVNYISCGEDGPLSMDYIKRNTDYNTDLIWECLLKQYGLEDIDQGMHLDYIPSEDFCVMEDKEKELENAVLIIFLEQARFKLDLVRTISKLSVSLKKIFVLKNSQREGMSQADTLLKNSNAVCIWVDENVTETDAFFYVSYPYWKNYKYIGYIHDADVYSPGKALKVGRSALFNRTENLLKNDCFITNALHHLEHENYLGALVVADPFHDDFFRNALKKEITLTSEDKLLTEELNINERFIPKTNIFGSTFTFWAKGSCMNGVKRILDSSGNSTDKNLFIKKIFCGLIQQTEFYCERIFSKDYLRLKMHFFQRNLVKLSKFDQQSTNENESDSFIRNKLLYEYCENKENIYIFGNGVFGKKCSRWLEENNFLLTGFLVSTKKDSSYEGYPVCKLSDINLKEKDLGIIIAISKNSVKDVAEELKRNGYQEPFLYL